MLKTLTIRNVALIDHAEIEFSDKLNVLSGETGAGKSVILDSIDFVLGAKADKSMIRHGESECSVRAEFFSEDPQLRQIMQDELDIEPDETIVISRKLGTDGRGNIRVNGTTVSASMLRRLTSSMVDVHGQSDHFLLLKEENQLKLLDKIAGNRLEIALSLVKNDLQERKQILAKLQSLGGNEEERSRRCDILRFQIEEIRRTDWKEGEEEELLSLRNRFRNAEKLIEGLSLARAAITEGEPSGTDAVNHAQRALSSIARYDAKYAELSERLENLSAELADIGDVLEEFLNEFDFDENEQERVESRLDEIKTLKKKYGGSFEEVQSYLTKSEEELSLLEHSTEEIAKLNTSLSVCDDNLFAACTDATAIRKATAEKFCDGVVNELKTLNIPSAKFEIDFQPYSRADVAHATQNGLDNIRFLFSANAGEPLKELGKIISGGEMSRFMLAVKAKFAGNVATCIFDEIDAGIGGMTARAIAEKFAKISAQTQVIAVSHLARIAAFADRQFYIEKKESGNRTYSGIREISQQERSVEIARMLTGEATELSLRQAGELLAEAVRIKQTLNQL